MTALPHYVNDARFSQPVLTVRTIVGDREVDLLHSPGNPQPGESSKLFVDFTNPPGVPTVIGPVVTIRQVQGFAPGRVLSGPDLARLDEDRYRLEFHYSEEGIYLVDLSYPDGEVESSVLFSVVVGTPGSPWVVLVCAMLGLGLLLVTVRAIRLKQQKGGSRAR